MRSLAWLLVLACACGPRTSVGVRSDYQATPDEFSPYGAQVMVVTGRRRYYGELLACDPGHVFLLVRSFERPWLAISQTHIREAVVHASDDDVTTGYSIWLLVGTLSTASHGLWAGATATVWLATGVTTAVLADSHAYIDGECEALRPYARYPQGLPSELRPRFTQVLGTHPGPLVPYWIPPVVPPPGPRSSWR